MAPALGIAPVAKGSHGPRSMDPAEAAAVLRRRLPDPKKPMTIADASVASGLAARDAEAGLHFLTHEYRGHLRVTEDGDLVHVFPHGFDKPWETRETLARASAAAWAFAVGAGRFIVRAWLLVAMLGYALIFLALVIGLTLARQGGDDREGSLGLSIFGGILRAIADAFFWTFHPWSPLYVERPSSFASLERPASPAERERDEVPFYEKVNRFVFGPTEAPPDPAAVRSRILEEIRAKRGRIGLADVMRVTGLPRDEADPLMARLMLDHEGSVEVGEQGGIVYRFEALRRTAAEGDAVRVPSAWERPAALAPLTANSAGANAGIALLNGFNAAASAWVIAKGLTLANIALLLFTKHVPGQPPVEIPWDGVPVALGLVPLVFSLGIFALPLGRLAARARAARRVAEENARLGILREVLTHAPKGEPVPDEALRSAYRVATGEEPSSKEITARVVELGGDVDVGPEGEVRYRFAELEAEAEALAEEREKASEAEARLGKIVFASDAD